MTRPLTPSEAADAREARRQALLDVQLEQLGRMVEAGMGMIAALSDQVAGTGPQVIEGDVALAYGRFSRAVRMAMLLQSHLLADPEDKASAQKAEPQETFVSWLEPLHEKRQARAERVEQIVERMVREAGESEEVVERLARETAERVEKIEVYGDLAMRPVSEVVAEICRDLGLKPDWTVLATHAWARKELDDGEIGWPLKDGPPPPEGWIGPWPARPPDPSRGNPAFPSKLGPPLPCAGGAPWPDDSA